MIKFNFFLEQSVSNDVQKDKLDNFILQLKSKKVLQFYKEVFKYNFEDTFIFFSSDSFDLIYSSESVFINILNLEKINHIRRINKFLESVNQKLEYNGIFACSVETYSNRKNAIKSKYPFLINYLFITIDFFFHRVLPKLKLTQKFYFYLTNGRNRVLSRAETLGRLYSCGFEVLLEREINNELYFVARKIGNPSFDMEPTYGPLIKLRRIGKDGKVFKVYKLRTMYPYSEYLQDYVFKYHQLDEGGKFKDDFRVSPIGRFFRKFWLDEIPMIWNLVKGDMKLIGVRPLSSQYFNLYTKELQEIRVKTKPGLLPPFYADMPKTLDEIMASEMKYLLAYEKAPLTTDLRYLSLIIKNILFRGARSK
ncbi:sugar transferase [Algoriphagus taiwanensis]|uniref:Bacterial sugar transferase domain-containing protein n=1 Tax=Algoriphagus taiwanensis TaxID=1445656 RepID=A0ABQ6Q4U8_9BACT|nr:hypothetical protein Ataiwa_27660 [Algoriphagus taiwanensis]